MNTATTSETATSETVSQRIDRLNLGSVSESRNESLAIAHSAGVDDSAFRKLASATRLSRGGSIVLKAHRYENLSRGRGWARSVQSGTTVWGERVDGGYRVGEGKWSVGGHDGFSRKDSTDWKVEHVSVGDKKWTIAN